MGIFNSNPNLESESKEEIKNISPDNSRLPDPDKMVPLTCPSVNNDPPTTLRLQANSSELLHKQSSFVSHFRKSVWTRTKIFSKNVSNNEFLKTKNDFIILERDEQNSSLVQVVEGASKLKTQNSVQNVISESSKEVDLQPNEIAETEMVHEVPLKLTLQLRHFSCIHNNLSKRISRLIGSLLHLPKAESEPNFSKTVQLKPSLSRVESEINDALVSGALKPVHGFYPHWNNGDLDPLEILNQTMKKKKVSRSSIERKSIFWTPLIKFRESVLVTYNLKFHLSPNIIKKKYKNFRVHEHVPHVDPDQLIVIHDRENMTNRPPITDDSTSELGILSDVLEEYENTGGVKRGEPRLYNHRTGRFYRIVLSEENVPKSKLCWKCAVPMCLRKIFGCASKEKLENRFSWRSFKARSSMIFNASLTKVNPVSEIGISHHPQHSRGIKSLSDIH